MFAGQRDGHQIGVVENTGVDGHLGQEGGAKTSFHHLNQSVQAGGGERVDLALVPQPAGAHRMLGETVLPLQQEDALVGQLLVVERGVQTGRHAGGHHHVEGILTDRLAVKAANLDGQGEDQQVELTLLQLFEQIAGGVFPQQQFEVRIGLAALFEQLAQEEGGNGGDAAQTHRPLHHSTLIEAKLHQVPRIGEQIASSLDDFHADRGHNEALVVTLHQLQVHHVLQRLDPGTQGRLTDMTGLGGAIEVFVLVESNQILQLFEAGPTLHRKTRLMLSI